MSNEPTQVDEVYRCPECGEPKQRIDDALVSGFVGHLCTNDDCPVDL